MNLLLVNFFQISEEDVINLDEEFRKEVTTVLSNCGLPMTVRIVSLSFYLFLPKINVQMENQNP